MYGSGESRADIREWLEDLSKPERESLLKSSLEMCEEAAGTCDDRVTLTWNELRKLRVHDDIRLGRYNNRPGDALRIMRQLFRQKKLQDIAYRQIAASPELDDVEVYLAYIVNLREPLALSMAPTDMRYFNLSGVTQADLDTALQEVQAAERTDFYKELVVDDTWNALIEQKLPDRYAQAKNKLHELGETPLQERISAELRALGLPSDDEDARRNIHKRVWHEMQFDILEPLTRDYLADAGIPAATAGSTGRAGELTRPRVR
ncbi:MAG TPA: NEL-type E3 ubiquitin ligase domain-containing protein [Bordetella sp.]|nr:NEL-type E3 ubiquitin ligase domain-containing protein [Bordetella sp.]